MKKWLRQAKEFKLQWEAIPQEKINTAGTVEVAATVIGLPIDAVKVTAKVSFEGELGEGKDTVKLKQLKLPMFKRVMVTEHTLL